MLSGPARVLVVDDDATVAEVVTRYLQRDGFAVEAVGEAGVERGVVRVAYAAATDDDAAKQFRLSVEDNGPGIPAEAMDKIFNPFFTTKDEGTGLGLAIVHRMVEAHDGTIVVTNGAGGGARFEIRV